MLAICYCIHVKFFVFVSISNIYFSIFIIYFIFHPSFFILSPLLYLICMMNSKVHMYRYPLTLHPSPLNTNTITVRTELYVCSNKTCDKTYRFPRYNDVSKVSKDVISHSTFFILHLTYRITTLHTHTHTYINMYKCTCFLTGH